jgi:hypothetical protein
MESNVEELSGDTSSSNSDDEVEDESEGENSVEQNLADEIEASNLQDTSRSSRSCTSISDLHAFAVLSKLRRMLSIAPRVRR